MPKNNVVFDKDYGYDKLFTSFRLAPDDTKVVVGFLRSGAIYDKTGVSVAKIAAIHEFGSKDGRIPERSFMRSSIDGNQKQLEDLIKKLTAKIVDKRMSTVVALGLIGQFLRDKMVSKINAGVPPPNAPYTIEKKGSSKPLIDTGQLKGSIDWEIFKGKKSIGKG